MIKGDSKATTGMLDRLFTAEPTFQPSHAVHYVKSDQACLIPLSAGNMIKQLLIEAHHPSIFIW